MTELIKFNDVSFQYNSQSAPTLHNLTVSIEAGEKVLVVGPSGSGKSTFANCLNGLIPHAYPGQLTGEISLSGKNTRNLSLAELSFQVGTVLQDPDGQFIGLTVAEDIAFALENEETPQDQMREQVAEMTDLVELSDYQSQRPQDLSGGQKQRVSMAGVLVDRVPILLMDEPLANLDPRSGKKTMALIDKICQQDQTTVIVIEHRLEDALFCKMDRIIVIDNGQIVADLPPSDLLKSQYLSAAGIREPLYVTALKYAQVDLAEFPQLDNLASLTSASLAANLTRWEDSISLTESVKKEAPLLEIKQLNYTYPGRQQPVLTDLDVTINQGEMISLVGKNGAGKSTLSKAICGFITPNSGTFHWRRDSINHLSIKERAEKIGYVMQNPNQMISKNMIFDEVALGLVLRQVPPSEIKAKVEATLKICGLYPFRNWPISALSFGQKKRVTIASILVLEPELLILDEPTAGQDFKHYTKMMLFLEKLNQQGITIMIITHDMHLMLEYTERTLVVHNGRLIADTTPVKVLTDAALVETAYLKETSLFTLAKQLNLPDPLAFTSKFISHDRQVRLS